MHRGTEVKAWPLTARPLPLWPRGPRRLRLNSGRRGSRAQALVAAGGPAGGDVERSRAFLGSNTVPAPAGLFHRGDTHFCSDKQGRSCCVLWLDGKCSNSKRGPVPVSTVRAALWRRPCVGHTVDSRAGRRAGLLRCFAGSWVARAVCLWLGSAVPRRCREVPDC